MSSAIIQWNLQSYYSHFLDLKLLLQEESPACVCLQETLLNNRKVYPPGGYKILISQPTREDGHERGAAILIHDRVFSQQILLDTELQAVAARVRLDKIYTVCSLYLPHDRNPNEKQRIIQLIRQLPPPILLLGDMNARSPLWGDNGVSSPNLRGEMFEEILMDVSVSLLNDGSPTHYHIQNNTYSVIDLSLISSANINEFTYSVLDSRYGSDHYPIRLTLNNNEATYLQKRERFCTQKADWALYTTLTSTPSTGEEFDNVEDLADYINATIKEAANQSIPKTSTKYQRPPIPWWNDNLKELRKKRNRAERALRRGYTIERKIAYNRAKATLTYHCRKEKKKSWEEYLSSINQDTTLNDVWTKVQRISGKFKGHPNPILTDENGRIATEEETVANILAKSFADISSENNYTNEFNRHRKSVERQPINFNTREPKEYNTPFSKTEFEAALTDTTNSSPGHDEIDFLMIKHCHQSLKNLILKLYNSIFETHALPLKWTIAITVGIPKPNKDPFHHLSYRPISLTLCLCKIMEKMVNNRLIWYLESNNLISVHQSGFRKNRSTADNLIVVDTAAREAVDKKKHFIGVFFDLKKAYDTAWRRGILNKLYSYDLRGNLPIFIQNFLQNRKLRVRVGNSLSDEMEVKEGVPQGSVLSCTLFMIAIDSICEVIPENIGRSLYVDDFAIFTSGSQVNQIQRRLQNAIKKLESWCQKTGFQFSTEKTVSIHICRKHHCPKSAPHLTLFNQPIRNEDKVKYLGLTFDNSLTWKPHINNLRRSCIKKLDLFKHLTSKRWGADRKSLLRLYIMLIKPKIDYGSEVYSAAADTYLKSITSIQNAAIRIATGAFRSSPIPSIHADSGLLPLQSYTDIKNLNYFVRSKCNRNSPINLIINDEQNNPVKSFLYRINLAVEKYNLTIDPIVETTLQFPPWITLNISSCKELYHLKKNEIPAPELKHEFNSHYRDHINSLCIFTDGSKEENHVGCAFAYGNETLAYKLPQSFSNFTAELYAILLAIKHAAEISENPNITIITDSRSSIQAIMQYQNQNPIVHDILHAIKDSQKCVKFCWVPSHIGVLLNERADRAAQQAAEIIPGIVRTPRNDIKAIIKQSVRQEWNTRWNNIPVNSNKLRRIKPHPTAFPTSNFKNRHWERVLCRLRIGHTTLTHGFLMDRGEMPYCEYCVVPLTVYHIIMECPEYNQERLIFGINRNNYRAIMSNLCDDGGPLKQFLCDINMLNKI